MRLVDTHMHLIDLDRFRYPWLDSEPRFNRDFPIDLYFSEATSLGIEKSLYMETDVVERQMESEVAFATSLGGKIAGIIAACRPENADFPEFVDRVGSNPKVKGFRRVLHTMPDDYSGASLFIENIRRLGQSGATFDLCVLARQIPAAARLARACPHVQFVLDHCGIPDMRYGEMTEWRRWIDLIAALPNVACKISGVIAYGNLTDRRSDDFRPVLEYVVDRFGWDRVVWGSDWPVCTKTASLTRWVEVSRQIFATCTQVEKTALFSGNAETIYRLSQ